MRDQHTIAGSFAACTLLLASAVANAAIQVDAASYDVQTNPQLLELQLFNPTLGTLNGATLTVGGSLSVSASVANNSVALNLSNVSVSLFGSLTANLTAGGPAALASDLSLLPPNSAMGTRTFVILGPGAHTSTGAFTVVTSPTVKTFSGAELLDFIGTGTFGYTFSSSAFGTVPARFTSVALAASAVSSGSLSISYDYTPASPVPISGGPGLLLSGIGLVSCLTRLKRRPALTANGHDV